ncbi:MAG TPA: replicative DNA helicase [Patescibacteria group bacterium]|jgi:replicative DNA helicase|nr:replicative DNA helicase [Patescibacteria group bacterium]
MADITLEKNLPHNLDAERSILGSIILENRALNQAQEILKEDDFYREGHRKIFRVMETLTERSAVIDLVTLKNELVRSGDLDAVGGPAYISSLIDGVPKSANVEHYARIVKEKSILRGLIDAGNRIINQCYEGEGSAEDLLDEAQKQIFAIAEGNLRSGFVPVRDVATPTLEYIDRLHERKELITGIPTGYERLDEMTSGLQNNDLIILAARPSMGKTALALNMAQHVATKAGRTVGLFSLEMSKEQLFLRMLCAQARVDAHKLRIGRLGKDEWTRLTLAFGELTEAKIFIDDSPGLSIFEMRAKARRLKAERGLDLLIVDYLQLMRGRARYENRTQEVSDISRSLKGLAKELGVPLIALSQLSRAPEQRSGEHRPQLSDLRESGSIEQDADVVLFIYREEVYKPTDDNQGSAQIIIGKQRNGPIGSLDLAFIKEYTKFENLEWRTA